MRSLSLLSFLLLFLCSAAQAADVTISAATKLIDSVEYVKSSPTGSQVQFETADQVVTTSDTFEFSSSLLSADSNALKVVIDYETFSPDGDNTADVDEIRAVVEQAVDGLWIPLGGQDKVVQAQPTRRLQIIDLSPRAVDSGQNVLVIPQGSVDAYMSVHDVKIDGSVDMRVRFYLKPKTNDLQSVTISCTVVPYQR